MIGECNDVSGLRLVEKPEVSHVFYAILVASLIVV